MKKAILITALFSAAIATAAAVTYGGNVFGLYAAIVDICALLISSLILRRRVE